MTSKLICKMLPSLFISLPFVSGWFLPSWRELNMQTCLYTQLIVGSLDRGQDNGVEGSSCFPGTRESTGITCALSSTCSSSGGGGARGPRKSTVRLSLVLF